MNPITHLITAAVCGIIAGLLEIAEQQSRKWYEDRAMLRASGFFLGLAIVFVAAAVF